MKRIFCFLFIISLSYNFKIPIIPFIKTSFKVQAQGIPSSTENLDLPLLPSTNSNREKNYKILNLGGESIKLDELGPIIINSDGTTRRIANWNELTQQEKDSTWRIISRRNKERIKKIEEEKSQ